MKTSRQEQNFSTDSAVKVCRLICVIQPDILTWWGTDLRFHKMIKCCSYINSVSNNTKIRVIFQSPIVSVSASNKFFCCYSMLRKLLCWIPYSKYSEIPLLRPPKIKTFYLLKTLFWKFKLFFSSFSTTSIRLIRDHLWDCPKVVFKTTFG